MAIAPMIVLVYHGPESPLIALKGSGDAPKNPFTTSATLTDGYLYKNDYLNSQSLQSATVSLYNLQAIYNLQPRSN